MIKLGQKIKFDPWHGINSVLGSREGGEVEGKVIFVNPKHSYFTAEYELGNERYTSSFHFCDVYGDGAYVRLVRG